jgi:hypothetical protein
MFSHDEVSAFETADKYPPAASDGLQSLSIAKPASIQERSGESHFRISDTRGKAVINVPAATASWPYSR